LTHSLVCVVSAVQLATEFEKGIPCEESILLPKLMELLIEHFGAVPKASGIMADAREAVPA
jgi:hypothetical protein